MRFTPSVPSGFPTRIFHTFLSTAQLWILRDFLNPAISPLGSKHSHQYPVLKHPKYMPFSLGERPKFYNNTKQAIAYCYTEVKLLDLNV
jgi:hypothetical protein